VGRGVYLRTHAHALLLDHSAQDVVMMLGPPQAVHFRHGAYVVSGATQHRMTAGTGRHGGAPFGKQRGASATGHPSLAALGHDSALGCREDRRWGGGSCAAAHGGRAPLSWQCPRRSTGAVVLLELL